VGQLVGVADQRGHRCGRLAAGDQHRLRSRLGTVFFGERFGIGRVIAAAAVALGIALVNL
jgi:hypothetical protein